MKQLLALILVFTAHTATANNYYPTDFQKALESDTLRGEFLKQSLFDILNTQHQRNGNQPDTLGCDRNKKGSCYRQLSLGYRGARKVLFGKLHLEEDSRGYYVKDVYCNKEFRNNRTKVGPNTIPNSNVLNCEHTWPQSKFTGKFDKGLQKSDLHHLFPSDSKANSVRGNYKFSDVNGTVVSDNCSASRTEGHGGDFEPPTEHKGNVARALFYFSVRYQISIDPRQEETMRRWHILDPVDAAEMERNEEIYGIQNNRNPFIDYPELVDRVNNF